MSHPYRVENFPQPRKPLPRMRARLRGLIRRVIAPAQAVGMLGGGFLFINLMTCAATSDKEKSADAHRDAHYAAWEQSLKERQIKLDIDEKAVAKREVEVTARTHAIEDIIAMSPLYVKQQDSAKPLLDALKRAEASK